MLGGYFGTPHAYSKEYQSTDFSRLDLSTGVWEQLPKVQPIQSAALVSDGRYRNRGPMSGGVVVDLQKSAVVLIGGIEVIVTAQVTQPYDVEIFYAHGIDPVQRHLLLLKSTNHFKAAFGPIARRVLNVSVPGLLAQDPRSVDYQNCRRPIYPLDEM